MSVEEKLEKCVEFIREIERGGADSRYSTWVSAHDLGADLTCDDCGSSDIYGEVRIGLPQDLRDRAWHLLADIEEI